jgi:hypothetical protein
MATMTEKRAMAKKRKANKAKRAASFAGGVYVAASFERKGAVYDRHGGGLRGFDFPGKEELSRDYSYVKRLYPDRFGNLVAEAFCGDIAFVCTKEELPEIVAFLQKLVEAK